MPVRLAVLRGFADAERNLIGAKKRWPPGSVVTFKYQNLTKNDPPTHSSSGTRVGFRSCRVVW